MAVTDENGIFALSNVPSGPTTVTGQLSGFQSARRSFVFDQRPRQADLSLQVAGISETVQVASEAPFINTRSSEISPTYRIDELRPQTQSNLDPLSQIPSVNVQNLQRRAAGVLPVRVEIPRAGTSHRFVKPLVIDEETVVSFRYRRR